MLPGDEHVYREQAGSRLDSLSSLGDALDGGPVSKQLPPETVKLTAKQRRRLK